ncbi:MULTISPECIES: penicillin-binding protein activator [unclassified Marinobacter]|uniref:penicillin-binding protein activator n=1 Tax=unclassified Marinobacter TaxID=83889 RepID=UPI0012683AB6|nr:MULTISPECIES: penicillin-binding protein activator [unclassified Marinobacter]QFS85927.1 Penicillin-binding protein activator LpoA precursor [Marinobacter sp. THAF197a]QFT49721.1 Penicillin-binding protein activator LpoA precursor [Marinobacter sp. THAF39]
MTKYRSHRTLFALITLVILLTAGCATVNLDSQVADTPERALELAASERNPVTAQRYLLRMASNFQDQGNHRAARQILRNQQLDTIDSQLTGQKLLLSMASAVELQDSDWANELVGNLSPDHFLGYPSDIMAKAAQLQAETFALNDDQLSAALTLMLLSQTDTQSDPQDTHDQIWQYLRTIPGQALNEASETAIGFEEQGWLELATTLRARDVGLDEQGRLIRAWQNNWPGHPAAQILPTDLRLLSELATSRPERIVLALPLQGSLASAGRAIRDGFLAAYFSDDSADRSKTDIRIVDTSSKPFTALYEELAGQNIDLIVGPLEKDALAGLSARNTLAVPVLGLNYLPADSRVPDGLYQFGLSAEDEARQIADQLAAQSLRQILVLIPRGEWGDRVEQALLQRMATHNGSALDIERFFPEDNFRSVTADLLGVTTSRQRAIQVERTIGQNVEFEPRRRQDAEAIVLVAQPNVARQFNPLFAFYFSGDLPVYAPSIVYEGTPDPGRDRDLNRVTFTDIPWVLAEDNPMRTQAEQNLSGTRGQLGRLFAMGADAWQLSKRLPLLRQVEGAAIDGQTGTLTMSPDGAIHRHQLWAQFQNGRPVLAPELNEATSREGARETEQVDSQRL